MKILSYCWKTEFSLSATNQLQHQLEGKLISVECRPVTQLSWSLQLTAPLPLSNPPPHCSCWLRYAPVKGGLGHSTAHTVHHWPWHRPYLQQCSRLGKVTVCKCCVCVCVCFFYLLILVDSWLLCCSYHFYFYCSVSTYCFVSCW